MNKYIERLYNGIVKENPTFMLMLGLCPTLAVTTSATNAVGMGLSTVAVLMLSNWIISIMRNIIPDRVRLPAEIVVVASLVTIVELLIKGFVPSLYDALGLYIPLIVVNCIILGRAEAYAMKNPPALSFMDGLGMGIGFTIALVAIGICREVLGSGSIFGYQFIPDDFHISIFVAAPGAFFVMAFLTAWQNRIGAPAATNGNAQKKASTLGCTGNCATCAGSIFEKNRISMSNGIAKAQALADAVIADKKEVDE